MGISGMLALGLGAAVTIGIVVRLIQAPKGRKLRYGLGPAAGAAEKYQELLVGREPTSQVIEHSFPAAPDDRASSGS